MIDLAPYNPHTLTIATPVIAAAGSLGDVVSVARWLGLAQPEADHGLGAIICSTVTVAGRRGQPQVLATPAGVLYHHGGASLGVKQVRERLAPAGQAITCRCWSALLALMRQRLPLNSPMCRALPALSWRCRH